MKNFRIECKECARINHYPECEYEITEDGELLIWCTSCGEEEEI